MRLIGTGMASVLLLAGIMAQASETLEQGIHAFHRGEYGEAVRVWVPLAEAGDPGAQLFLGHAYSTGKGVEADARQSFLWYLKAAEQGLPEAQYEVGLMYEVGEGVPADVAEAEYWYQKATSGGLCPGELSGSGRLLD